MRADEDSDSVWLDRLCLRYGFRDKSTLLRDLRDIRRRIRDVNLADSLLDLVARRVGETATPGMALTFLDRLIGSLPDPDAVARMWLTQQEQFLELLKLLGTTPHVAKLVLAHHSAYQEIAPLAFPSRDELVAQAWEQVREQDSDRAVSAALHRFRGLWTLRIAADDLIRDGDVPRITARIADLADACLDAALRWSLARREAAIGPPRTATGTKCRLAALALGKLGGRELNYSSDVDLIFVFDEDGRTERTPVTEAPEHFARVIADFLKIMAGAGSTPAILRVDLRLRPEGSQGPMAMSLDQTLNYYDSAGRTWERQALIKMRPCAGDLDLGQSFVRLIEPFVYRRYLSAVEIAEIQAMKRRIEHRAKSEGVAEWDVKTGFGGIRDVEFVVQFLQLLNGCTLPGVRESNTIESLKLLKSAGCLTPVEHDTLLRNYLFLRKTEHRLQLEEDRQTHRIPQKPESRSMLAMGMGFLPLNAWENPEGPFERFFKQYEKLTQENNAVLNRLLHDAFRTDDSARADPVSDLILDPEMPAESQYRILENFGLVDKPNALRYLECMAREEKPYFSTPRCRHFFAAVAPKLLHKVARSPFPDNTLARLDTISRVMPVKALLWESLSSSAAALDGFVRMASENRFVAEAILARPRSWELWYRQIARQDEPAADEAEDATGSAFDAGTETLARFRQHRDDRWLAIVARHPLPLTVANVRSMQRQMSRVADMTIQAVARSVRHEKEPAAKPAHPPGRWAILALGKAGCESLALHSDLDLVFVHEAEGKTEGPGSIAADRRFEDLASRFLRAMSDRGPGFLYRVDTRLRPFGESGALSVPIDRLRTYYRSGEARVWERLAMLRARPAYVDGFDPTWLTRELAGLAFESCPSAEKIRSELATIRERIRRSIETSPDDLKRGHGGSQAIELLVQALQLIGMADAGVPIERDEWAAIGQLGDLGLLAPERAAALSDAYGLYRQVDWALRLYRNRAPEPLRIDPRELPFLERMIVVHEPDSAVTLFERIELAQMAVRDIVREFHEGRIGSV